MSAGPTSSMPILKRVLLFFAELSILVAGIAAAFALLIHFAREENPLWESANLRCSKDLA